MARDQLELRTHYWDDRVSKKAFMAFIHKIHGLDFRLWDNMGFWDASYTPFSLFLKDEVIASVCIYLLDAVVLGQPCQFIQISGVGTHEDWRRMGLSRELTRVGLEWAGDQHAGLFLFADEEAIPYYQKTGFIQKDDFCWASKLIPVSPKKGLVKLHISESGTLERIFRAAQDRAALSDQFSVINPRLVMFHAIYTLADCVYSIPALDCILFFRRRQGVLHIYDILAPRVPLFETLLPYLYQAGDTDVQFYFFVDKLGVQGGDMRLLEGNNFFTRDQFPLDPVIFPYTSKA